MEEVLGVIVHNGLGVITGAALALIGAVLRSLWKHMQATQNGVQCMLRGQIIDIYNRSLDRGYCHIYEKENLTKAYQSYQGLGGNGVVTGLYNTVMEMPTEPPTEEEDE